MSSDPALDPALKLVLSADIPEARLAAMTRDLIRDLSRAGVDARASERPAGPGERGLGLGLGEIVVLYLAHGGAVLLAECIKNYVFREPTLKVAVLGADGKPVTVVDAKSATGDGPAVVLKAHEAQA